MSGESDIRLLLMSADPTLVAELRHALNVGGFHLDVAADPREALVALRRLPAELTLVDIGDGDTAGLRALELVGTTSADTALIAVSSTASEEVAAAAFARGAQECLIGGSDDIVPARLVRALRNALARSAHDGSRPLATLVELSSDAILTVNRDRLVTRFNHAAEELYGWSACEVLCRPVRNLIPAAEHPQQAVYLDKVLGGENFGPVELSRTMRDGRQVIMSMVGSPIVDAFGDVLEACMIIRNVTAEVLERTRVLEQQHLLESSQAAGHIGSWAVDLLTGRIDWSAEHYRLLKRDPTLGPARIEDLLDVVHPDDRELVERSFSRAASFTFEARLVADAADVRILRVRGEYLPRERGKKGRLLGITQDVTAEHAQQTAREEAEDRLRRGFEEALIGMVIMDMDGLALQVNAALCEIFGLTRAQILTHDFQEFTHPDDVGDDVPVMAALLSGVQKHHVREKRYIHADGHVIWAEVGLSLITNADGSPSHMVGQIQDITERRAHVENLRHMADHDPLTGLLNRRAFARELSAHIGRSKRYGVSGAVLMLDLDNFKQHNDTHGHGAGDQLLMSLADGLRGRLRATDVTGRLGGDEFAALLPHADRMRANAVSESLLAHIRSIVGQLDNGGTQITASVGVVSLARMETLTPEAVMRAADQAMYEAKRRGRDRCAEWLPTFDGFIPTSE